MTARGFALHDRVQLVTATAGVAARSLGTVSDKPAGWPLRASVTFDAPEPTDEVPDPQPVTLDLSTYRIRRAPAAAS